MDVDHRFRHRPLDKSQVAAWAALLDAIEAVDHQDETMGEENLRTEFDDPAQDFIRGSVAVYDGPSMVAYCVLTPRCAEEPLPETRPESRALRHRVRHAGGVHPAYRERGIGSALLSWAEETAGPLHDDEHPGRPLSLSGRFPSRLTDAGALFTAYGYQPERWHLRMTADLRGVIDEPPVPNGIRIVPYTQERSADALLIKNESFRDHWGTPEHTPQEWAHFLAYQAFKPEFSFLAYEGSEPLGAVIGQEYEEYNRVAGHRDLYIPLVGTRRQARRRGIASALVRCALAAAKADGVESAALDVDADSPTGAVGLYERIGFSVQDTWVSQSKHLVA